MTKQPVLTDFPHAVFATATCYGDRVMGTDLLTIEGGNNDADPKPKSE